LANKLNNPKSARFLVGKFFSSTELPDAQNRLLVKAMPVY